MPQPLLLLVLILLVPTGSLASEAEVANDGFFIGVKGSGSFSGLEQDLRVVWGLGLLAGYRFANGFGVEGELVSDVGGGKIDPGGPGDGGEWSISTAGVYGAWRSRGKAYFKGKLGWLQRDVDIDPDLSGAGGSEGDVSAGAGFGLQLGKRLRMEWEYTWITSDFYAISYAIVF